MNSVQGTSVSLRPRYWNLIAYGARRRTTLAIDNGNAIFIEGRGQYTGIRIPGEKDGLIYEFRITADLAVLWEVASAIAGERGTVKCPWALWVTPSLSARSHRPTRQAYGETIDIRGPRMAFESGSRAFALFWPEHDPFEIPLAGALIDCQPR